MTTNELSECLYAMILSDAKNYVEQDKNKLIIFTNDNKILITVNLIQNT